jgi:SAM-dependent methyltransferase
MCHVSVFEFFISEARKEEFEGKSVLEVGSRYVNGSVRSMIVNFLQPSQYLGVDVESGPLVDLVLPAEKLLEFFGPDSFDVVISTELLEHVQDWRLIINNMKSVLRTGGYIYISTRSYGFPFHAFPYDFWRYELNDMKKIFADFDIIKLKQDKEAPGVFLKARKPAGWRPVDLSGLALYSMVLGRRTTAIPTNNQMPFTRRMQASVRTLLVALLDIIRRKDI